MINLLTPLLFFFSLLFFFLALLSIFSHFFLSILHAIFCSSHIPSLPPSLFFALCHFPVFFSVHFCSSLIFPNTLSSSRPSLLWPFFLLFFSSLSLSLLCSQMFEVGHVLSPHRAAKGILSAAHRSANRLQYPLHTSFAVITPYAFLPDSSTQHILCIATGHQ